MRKLGLLFVVLAACELQPAPPKQEAPPAASAPTPPPAPADAGAAAVAGDGGPQWSDACKDGAIHIAEVIIATTTDVAQRSIFEHDREKMIRSVADVCMRQQWSDVAIKCYEAAKTQPDLKACEKQYTPVPVPPPQPKIDENAAPLPPGRVPGQIIPAGSAKGSGSGSAKPH